MIAGHGLGIYGSGVSGSEMRYPLSVESFEDTIVLNLPVRCQRDYKMY